MNKRVLLALPILLVLALLAGLRSRQAARERAVAAGNLEVPAAPAGGAGKTESPREPPGEKPPPPTGNSSKLHGLRLLATETAAVRGWKPPRIAEEDPLHKARKLWSRTEVSLNFADEPMDKLLAWLGDKYGLHAQIDSAISLEGKTITFKVDDLAGDQTLDLITKMAGLGFAIDASGTAWVTTEERAKLLAAPPEPQTDPWQGAAHRIRWEEEARSKKVPRPHAEPSWKGKKVTLSIVRKPIKEALTELAAALGVSRGEFTFWEWHAYQKADAALPVSVVGEDMPVEQAIEEILRGSGIVMTPNGEGRLVLELAEKAEADRSAAEAGRKADAEDAAEVAAFRKRRVSIRGDLLTAAEVAAQVGAQTGVSLRVSAEVADCRSVWESDGLEQPAGDVLDILARDGELLWRWQGEAEPTEMHYHGARCLWVVGAKER